MIKTEFLAAEKIIQWVRKKADFTPDGEARQALEEAFQAAVAIRNEVGLDMTQPSVVPASSQWQCVQISMTGTIPDQGGNGGMDGTHLLPLGEDHIIDDPCPCEVSKVFEGVFLHCPGQPQGRVRTPRLDLQRPQVMTEDGELVQVRS
jgi:hypothetical protein